MLQLALLLYDQIVSQMSTRLAASNTPEAVNTASVFPNPP